MKSVCLLFIALVLLVGCSGDYGIIKSQTSTDNKMTLAELRENREDYHIYYENSGNLRNRIMFDPKNDETRLVGDSWHKIEDQQTLSETIREIQTIHDFTEVMIIEGQDGRLLGYMYYSWGYRLYGTPSDIVVRRVDEHTVYVQAW